MIKTLGVQHIGLTGGRAMGSSDKLNDVLALAVYGPEADPYAAVTELVNALWARRS